MTIGKNLSFWVMTLLLAFFMTSNLDAQRKYGDVYFDSDYYPEQYIWLNDNFIFDFNAEAKDGGDIRYQLVNDSYIPDGMVIDEATGVLTWTADLEGVIYVHVLASLTDDDTKFADAYLVIISRDRARFEPCAAIQGKVQFDDTGDPVPGAWVWAINASIMDDSTGIYWPQDLMAITDDDGNYSIPVPAGSYKLMVQTQFTKEEWYQDQRDWESATIVGIQCDDLFTADFSVAYGNRMYFTNYIESPFIPLDQEWVFEPVLEKAGDFVVKFSLIDQPEGMTIDENSGRISWTPTVEGMYSFRLVAYNEAHPDEYIEMWIDLFALVDKEPCATISGKISDPDGNPMANAYVIIYNAEFMKYGLNFPGMDDYYKEVTSDEEGNYSTEMPDGEYLVVAWAENAVPTWYENAQNEYEATTVLLECASTFTANITTQTYEPPQEYLISGRVTDEVTGEPVAAYVYTMIADPSQSDSLWGRKYMLTATMTDEDGYYQMPIIDFGMEIQIFARDIEGMYLTEYYNNTNDITEAESILPEGDLENIDFTLTPRPNYDNEVHGYVLDEDGNPVYANVIAWQTDTDPNGFESSSQTVETDDYGKYVISNLIPGTYVLFAMSNDYKMLPGFYNENGEPVYDYMLATPIVIGENDKPVTDFNIILSDCGYREDSTLVYLGEVRGTVTADDPSNGQTTLAGVLITVSNINDEVLGYSMSDEYGKFDISNLDEGMYRVSATKKGYETYSTQTNMLENNMKQNINIKLEELTTGVDDITADDADMNIYPNPATDAVSISFNGMQSTVSLRVTNSLGMEVISQEINSISGMNLLNLNTASLPTGVYYLSISGNGMNMLRQFTVVR
jgi:protocatechuate 3,4-dioxygenase beta subunit